MSCDLERLSALRDGDLAPRAAARLRAHLVGCAACRAELAGLDALVGGLAALPSVAPPPGDFAQILQALDHTARLPRRFAPRRRRVVVVVAIAASVLLAALGGGIYGVRARRVAASDHQLLAQAESEFRLAEAHYRRAIERLRKVAEPARARLTAADRAAAAQAQAALESATERCRVVARAQPADPEAAERLFAAYRQQIRFYEDELLRGGVTQ